MVDSTNLLTMGETAKLLGVTKARVSQLTAAGRLEVAMVGGRKMVVAASVDRYVRDSQAPATKKARYTLMAADYEVATVAYDGASETPFSVDKVLDVSRMPFSTATSGGNARPREFNAWWEHRSVPHTRPGLLLKMPELGVGESWQIPMRSLGLSLSDYYWLRPEGRADLTWQALNYFENDFEGSGEGSWDRWDQWLANLGLDSPDNTSEGELPKRWIVRNGVRMLVKGCRSDDQRPWNEVVATALHRRLLDPCDYVAYEPMAVGGMPACACADFLRAREEYIPAAYLKDCLGRTRGSSTYERLNRYAGMLGTSAVCVRERIDKMIVCDSILANSDRHWRNFGFVRDVDTLAVRPAPIFDSGNSLWYEKSAAEVAAGDRGFAARPYGPEPERQLALVGSISWFDSAALDGFVDEAASLLEKSAHAGAPGRLDYVIAGLRDRVRAVTTALGVLRYRR